MSKTVTKDADPVTAESTDTKKVDVPWYIKFKTPLIGFCVVLVILVIVASLSGGCATTWAGTATCSPSAMCSYASGKTTVLPAGCTTTDVANYLAVSGSVPVVTAGCTGADMDATYQWQVAPDPNLSIPPITGTCLPGTDYVNYIKSQVAFQNAVNPNNQINVQYQLTDFVQNGKLVTSPCQPIMVKQYLDSVANGAPAGTYSLNANCTTGDIANVIYSTEVGPSAPVHPTCAGSNLIGLFTWQQNPPVGVPMPQLPASCTVADYKAFLGNMFNYVDRAYGTGFEAANTINQLIDPSTGAIIDTSAHPITVTTNSLENTLFKGVSYAPSQ